MMNVFYINLNRSNRRREEIERLFQPNTLIRVSAVDGLDYSDGTFDDNGRPNWDLSKRRAEVMLGRINSPCIRGRELYPSEYGCALSHIKAWKAFLDTGGAVALFIEDDVMPSWRLEDKHVCDVLDGLPEYQKSDMFFPISPSEPWRPIRLGDDGSVKGLRSHMAYTLTRNAAGILVKNVFPLLCAIDAHVGFRFLEGMQTRFTRRKIPDDLPEVPTLKAYGMKTDPLIIPNAEIARETTFTNNGRKGWIDDRYKESWVA